MSNPHRPTRLRTHGWGAVVAALFVVVGLVAPAAPTGGSTDQPGAVTLAAARKKSPTPRRKAARVTHQSRKKTRPAPVQVAPVVTEPVAEPAPVTEANLALELPAGAPSGEAMPVGDIPGWRQIFADDFTTDVPLGSFPAAVSSKWSAYPDGWKDTSKNGTYSPSKVLSVSGGLLNMHLRTENGVRLVAAPVPKLPSTGGRLYGRYSVRFRADSLPGYKTAWLLWPDSEVWPRDGEIDFPEGDLDGVICGFSHYQGASSGSEQDGWCTRKTYPSWHTATVEWTASAVRFILDGEVVGTSTTRVPNTSMHYVLQTETSLDRVPSESVAGNVQIDWVSIYEPA